MIEVFDVEENQTEIINVNKIVVIYRKKRRKRKYRIGRGRFSSYYKRQLRRSQKKSERGSKC